MRFWKIQKHEKKNKKQTNEKTRVFEFFQIT